VPAGMVFNSLTPVTRQVDSGMFLIGQLIATV
jgi:hypothetical protein